MRTSVLWLCNIPLPRISEDLGLKHPHLGGWLEGMAYEINKISGLDLTVVFPISKAEKIVSGQVDGISYLGVPSNPYTYSLLTEDYFKAILTKNNPDVVHIHGTEQSHSLAMVNAALATGHIEKTFISIQGLVSIYQQHYIGYMPYKYTKPTLKDLIKKRSLAQQQKLFASLGQFEIEAIRKVKHIIGRTTWDKACTSQINPNATYHFCNENLRDEFYQHEWKLSDCIRHSLFTSQAYYPLKGFHLLLEALSIVVRYFPDAHLYVTGYDNSNGRSILKKRLWSYQYPKYVGELIDRYDLRNKITYTGMLDASAMCERYLQSHVFVLPSSIENSPNSLGEAMLLGVPCVASYVGGAMDMLEHRNEGLLYQPDAPYMMAHHICELFNDDDLSQHLAANARKRALVTHNKITNAHTLFNIYNSANRMERSS